jgi:hypothetical protein
MWMKEERLDRYDVMMLMPTLVGLDGAEMGQHLDKPVQGRCRLQQQTLRVLLATSIAKSLPGWRAPAGL